MYSLISDLHLPYTHRVSLIFFKIKSVISLLKGFLPGRRRYEDEWRTVYVLNKYPSDDADVEVKQSRYADNVIVTSKVSFIYRPLPFILWHFFNTIKITPSIIIGAFWTKMELGCMIL